MKSSVAFLQVIPLSPGFPNALFVSTREKKYKRHAKDDLVVDY